MQIRFTLELPRDALSVPIVRRVLNSSMRTLGVAEGCLTDIGVALTEACTNVLDHAVLGDEYEVVAGLDDNACVIEVIDAGRGFDADTFGHADADPTAEQGRGLQLIRSLVDRVQFDNRPETGTIVHLEKRLAYDEGSPMQRLVERSDVTTAIDLGKSDLVKGDRQQFESTAFGEPG